MWIWEQARGVARWLSLALTLGPVWLPLAAAAGQSEPDEGLIRATPPAAALNVRSPNSQGLSGASSQLGAEPFGFTESDRAQSRAFAEKWRSVEDHIAAEAEVLAQCRSGSGDCPSAARQFLDIVASAASKDGRARLGEINRAINLSIRYTPDEVQYGQADVWSSPLATLAAGRGDCEDYAIAKYVALREAGTPESDLRLMVVRDARIHEFHAVLTVRLDARWLVLDNRRLLLLEDRDLPDYAAVAAFGREDTPVFAASGLPPLL